MKRTFALSDLHGCYDLWVKIKDYIYPEDTLIFLGDAIDRGPDGIKIVEELRNRPNTIYLRGNHEDIAAAALKDMITGALTVYNNWYSPIDLWQLNGGSPTEAALTNYTTEDRKELSNYFAKLPIQYTYINKNKQIIICDHCGYTPGKTYQPLWDRSHFIDEWPLGYDHTYIIHGHTPAEYLGTYFVANGISSTVTPRGEIKIIHYCNNHKLDIDMGSVWNHVAVLLNLDTFEEIYFYGTQFKKI